MTRHAAAPLSARGGPTDEGSGANHRKKSRRPVARTSSRWAHRTLYPAVTDVGPARLSRERGGNRSPDTRGRVLDVRGQRHRARRFDRSDARRPPVQPGDGGLARGARCCEFLATGRRQWRHSVDALTQPAVGGCRCRRFRQLPSRGRGRRRNAQMDALHASAGSGKLALCVALRAASVCIGSPTAGGRWTHRDRVADRRGHIARDFGLRAHCGDGHASGRDLSRSRPLADDQGISGSRVFYPAPKRPLRRAPGGQQTTVNL